MKKILRTCKVVVVVATEFFFVAYNWHRLAWLLVSMCVWVVCIDARATLEICYGSRLLLLLLFSATCNLRQTRLTSSSHTWKPANANVSVRFLFTYYVAAVVFLPSSISLFFGLPLGPLTVLLTHAHTQRHTRAAVCVKISSKTSSAGFCYEHKKRQASERNREKETTMHYFLRRVQLFGELFKQFPRRSSCLSVIVGHK